jgi:hypothetical protein
MDYRVEGAKASIRRIALAWFPRPPGQKICERCGLRQAEFRGLGGKCRCFYGEKSLKQFGSNHLFGTGLRGMGFESVRPDMLCASKHRLFFSMNTIRGRVLAGGVAAAMSIPANFYE